MPKKSMHLLMVIMLLAAAALACNTVTGGGGLSPDDIAATAVANSEDPDLQATIAAAEETAAAANGNDSGEATATETGSDPGDNGNTGTDPFDGQGPADIPVLDTNAELVLGDDTSLTYYLEATFDETVDFYRTAMLEAGWEATANGDVVFGGLAALQFTMDTRTANVTVTDDPTSERTLVAIVVTE